MIVLVVLVLGCLEPPPPDPCQALARCVIFECASSCGDPGVLDWCVACAWQSLGATCADEAAACEQKRRAP